MKITITEFLSCDSDLVAVSFRLMNALDSG